jgi:hypothetical protein
MEEQKATEVKCKACESSRQIKNTQTFVLLFGGIFTFFAIYGLVSAIRDFINIF